MDLIDPPYRDERLHTPSYGKAFGATGELFSKMRGYIGIRRAIRRDQPVILVDYSENIRVLMSMRVEINGYRVLPGDRWSSSVSNQPETRRGHVRPRASPDTTDETSASEVPIDKQYETNE